MLLYLKTLDFHVGGKGVSQKALGSKGGLPGFCLKE